VFQGHTSNIRCLAMLQNGNLVSGSYDKTLRVWDSNDGFKAVLVHQWETYACLLVLNDSNLAEKNI
jgi:WD40 repeat protein